MEKRDERIICKTCKNKFNSGVWLASKFSNERVILFCSEKCKIKYLKTNLRRIKEEYPHYYQKIKNEAIL